MPNIKSAKKKMKQDVARTERNAAYAGKIEGILRSAKGGVKTKKKEFVNDAYAAIDKAAKKNIIHKNTAGRLKKRVSRLVTHAS